MLCLAKGLGNGVPIGACLAKGSAAEMLLAGTHGSTFGGNPLVCKVALSVLDVFKEDLILNNVNLMSDYINSQLKKNLTDFSAVVQIRVKGLMIGIGLNENTIDCTQLLQKALDDELLINIAGNSIRMLPPLIITQQEVDTVSYTHLTLPTKA